MTTNRGQRAFERTQGVFGLLDGNVAICVLPFAPWRYRSERGDQCPRAADRPFDAPLAIGSAALGLRVATQQDCGDNNNAGDYQHALTPLTGKAARGSPELCRYQVRQYRSSPPCGCGIIAPRCCIIAAAVSLTEHRDAKCRGLAHGPPSLASRSSVCARPQYNRAQRKRQDRRARTRIRTCHSARAALGSPVPGAKIPPRPAAGSSAEALPQIFGTVNPLPNLAPHGTWHHLSPRPHSFLPQQ